MPFEWSEAHVLGVAALDDEHRRLMALLHRSVGALFGPTAALERSSLVDRMVQALSDHCAWEEALMAEMGYPGLYDHANDHARAIVGASMFRRYIDTNSGRGVALDIAFLEDAFLEHVCSADAGLARFIKARTEVMPTAAAVPTVPLVAMGPGNAVFSS